MLTQHCKLASRTASPNSESDAYHDAGFEGLAVGLYSLARLQQDLLLLLAGINLELGALEVRLREGCRLALLLLGTRCAHPAPACTHKNRARLQAQWQQI